MFKRKKSNFFGKIFVYLPKMLYICIGILNKKMTIGEQIINYASMHNAHFLRRNLMRYLVDKM